MQDFVLQPRGQDHHPVFPRVLVEVSLARGVGRGGEAEEGEGGSCQTRLPPADQTAGTYDVWWQQTRAWVDRREADLLTRPFADRAAYDQPGLRWAQTSENA